MFKCLIDLPFINIFVYNCFHYQYISLNNSKDCETIIVMTKYFLCATYKQLIKTKQSKTKTNNKKHTSVSSLSHHTHSHVLYWQITFFLFANYVLYL